MTSMGTKLTKEIYKKLHELYGTDGQVFQCIEEMGELAQALSKHRRCPDIKTEENVAEELADCWIMLEQLAFIFYNGS